MDRTLFESNSKSRFRLVGLLEGTSFLLLLFIAMPLKYIWDWPLAVKYVGWAHGVLFIAYGITLVTAAVQREWSLGKVFLAGVMSLIPFGPFYLEGKVKNWP